ncbi:hypothetical protein B0T18DRAFT_492386 [Schizothecium vesticola]|uniref:Uncharacterized protein n=1 Tax=Schizothecium vesticola TaxID=314040 RepID=A0AA40BQ83_9PEZI|nr:hypothetical protein B0T18DRAFT_492386 [Schizothecium vesticola]
MLPSAHIIDFFAVLGLPLWLMDHGAMASGNLRDKSFSPLQIVGSATETHSLAFGIGRYFQVHLASAVAVVQGGPSVPSLEGHARARRPERKLAVDQRVRGASRSRPPKRAKLPVGTEETSGPKQRWHQIQIPMAHHTNADSPKDVSLH